MFRLSFSQHRQSEIQHKKTKTRNWPLHSTKDLPCFDNVRNQFRVQKIRREIAHFTAQDTHLDNKSRVLRLVGSLSNDGSLQVKALKS